MGSKHDSESLKKRLRYQGDAYSGGSSSRGGGTEIHYLTQAADYIDALEAQLAVEKYDANRALKGLQTAVIALAAASELDKNFKSSYESVSDCIEVIQTRKKS